MLSSFIVLAAANLSPAHITAATAPAPVAFVEPAPAIVAEPLVVTTAPVAPPKPAPIPVQATPQEPDPAPTVIAPEIEPSKEVPAPQDSAQSEPVADPSIVSPTERRAILKTAENALARVETAQGRFVQLDVNGGISEGSFALQRPGRMRFDYDDPVPILIASDGTTVAMRDDELETVDRVPLGSTPLSLLLSNSVDFENDTDVIRVQKASGMVAITVRDPSAETDGELSLIFDAGSYDMISWRVVDANGGITSVSLSEIQTGISLNPRLFIVRDFEDEEDDRRR
ncbi:MAG: outer-membrane lipoprotein carrier protein LolA [Pseudomonadota bacterium]